MRTIEGVCVAYGHTRHVAEVFQKAHERAVLGEVDSVREESTNCGGRTHVLGLWDDHQAKGGEDKCTHPLAPGA